MEAALDGRTERLSLKVVIDRETISWEIKPDGRW
jgi:hypothetical protein